jgi:CRP/FNR family transcriptional regulator, cyclic AMP receptor protein
MDAAAFSAVLQELSFAADLSPTVVNQLAAVARYRSAARGEVLFREGEACNDFFIVQSGRVGLEMCVPARGCMYLLSLGEGEIVAWSALVGGGRMTATAIALEDALLISLPGAELLELCDVDHDFGYALMRRLATTLSRRLVATRLQMLDIFSREATLYGESSLEL